MWDGLDRNLSCVPGRQPDDKGGLEPLNLQRRRLGSNGTRALKNQERTSWSLSPDSTSIHCGQLL